MLLNTIKACKKDNERVRMINHQFKAKCESQRAALEVYKFLSPAA